MTMKNWIIGLSLAVSACAAPAAQVKTEVAPGCESALDRQLATVKESSEFRAATPEAQQAIETLFAEAGPDAQAKCQAAETQVDDQVVACLAGAKGGEAVDACTRRAPPTCEVVIERLLVLLTESPQYKEASPEIRQRMNDMMTNETSDAIQKCKDGVIDQAQQDCIMAATTFATAQTCEKKP
jgi:hypothetical protein